MFLSGSLNADGKMSTGIRYIDIVNEAQLLVVFNPCYIPKSRERVELMWHGTPEKNYEDGFHKAGYVNYVENFIDCTANVHELTIGLSGVLDVK